MKIEQIALFAAFSIWQTSCITSRDYEKKLSLPGGCDIPQADSPRSQGSSQTHMAVPRLVSLKGGRSVDRIKLPHDAVRRRLRSPVMNDVEKLGEGRPVLFRQGGVTCPTYSEEAKRVVLHGEAAIPLLVSALKSDNGVMVGNAILCLLELHYYNAIHEVETARVRFDRKRAAPSDGYALISIDLYLDVVKFENSLQPE